MQLKKGNNNENAKIDYITNRILLYVLLKNI